MSVKARATKIRPFLVHWRGRSAASSARGATVVVAALDEAAAQETAQSVGGHAVRCDVTKREDVEAAVEAAVAHGGSLDILVTCAGIIRDDVVVPDLLDERASTPVVGRGVGVRGGGHDGGREASTAS